MEIKGIDVSKWNGTIDWKRVAADGVHFAMIRAATGSKSGKINVDPKMDANINGAHVAGIKVGVYLYSYAYTVDAARKEAENLVKVLDKHKDKITWPVAYDIEESGQATDTRRATNTAQAKVFCDVVMAEGYNPILYANPNWLYNFIDAKTVGVDVWLAHYTYTPGVTSYKGTHTIHQYSDEGCVFGISGNVDLNVAYKDYGEDNMVRYKFAYECPAWAMDTLKKLNRKKLLVGKGDAGLDLTEDMLRLLVVMDRAGAFGD